MTGLEAAVSLAAKLKALGGRAYFVGGCVRDKVMKGAYSPDADFDIEVHGVSPQTLEEVLKGIGTPMEIGKSFGIFSLRGLNLDIAMPRTETLSGRGHRDFKIDIDPFLGEEKAAKRRDFTCNALMEDILSGEILDFFGGREDIRAGVLRHVDDNSFGEDPLRVLRLARFAARFGFTPAPETLEICRKTDITALSRERVFEELKKALLKSDKPSVFFEVLRQCNALSFWFPEVEALIDLPQNPAFHPEGDVFVHTMIVLDKGARYRNKTDNPTGFMLSCLCHDMGKATTTEFFNGAYHAYRHEEAGVKAAGNFLKRLSSDRRLREYVKNTVLNHMRPNKLYDSNSKFKKTNALFDEVIDKKGIIYIALCDAMIGTDTAPAEAFLFDRLAEYERAVALPGVTGADLISAGLKPNEDFTRLLALGRKLQLGGTDKDTALRLVLNEARKRG